MAAVVRAQGLMPADPAAGAGTAGAMPEDLVPKLRPILLHALERSPDAIRHGLDIEQAEARAYVSRGAMLPNLGVPRASYAVNSASTASSNSSATSNSSGFFWGVELNQPVYQWGALKAQVDIDRLSIKIAERQYAESARILANLVRKSYLELVFKKSTLKAAKGQLDLEATGLAREEERFTAKKITAGDIVGKRMDLKEHQLKFDGATEELAYLKRVFIRLAGFDDLPDDAIADLIPPPVPAADKGEELLHNFLRDGPAATYQGQVYSFLIQQSELSYKIAKFGLYPKFSFNAGHSVSNSTQADVNTVHQEAIVQNYYGVIANWTIFDSFATGGRKQEALARKRSNEVQLKAYADATADLAQNFRRQAEFAARALEFAETRLNIARAGLTFAKENLASKVASQDDVDRATVGLLAAEAATVFVRAEYLNRWTEFVSLVGADRVMNNLPPRYVR